MSVLSFLTSVADAAVLSTAELSTINTSIETLESRLLQHFNPGAIRQKFRFGSSTRGTILPRSMDQRSDIDYMIEFADGSGTPQTHLNRLRTFVERRYGTSEIYQSSPTIVLELNHIKFDVVPATRNWLGELQIPDGSGGWMTTSPKDFNSQLEEKNKQGRWLLKPAIRLFKFWNAMSGYSFSSFEMERWAAARSFWFAANLRDYFFTIIESLNTDWSYSQKVNGEITRAKAIVERVKQYERSDMHTEAEKELRRLFRL